MESCRDHRTKLERPADTVCPAPLHRWCATPVWRYLPRSGSRTIREQESPCGLAPVPSCGCVSSSSCVPRRRQVLPENCPPLRLSQGHAQHSHRRVYGGNFLSAVEVGPFPSSPQARLLMLNLLRAAVRTAPGSATRRLARWRCSPRSSCAFGRADARTSEAVSPEVAQRLAPPARLLGSASYPAPDWFWRASASPVLPRGGGRPALAEMRRVVTAGVAFSATTTMSSRLIVRMGEGLAIATLGRNADPTMITRNRHPPVQVVRKVDQPDRLGRGRTDVMPSRRERHSSAQMHHRRRNPSSSDYLRELRPQDHQPVGPDQGDHLSRLGHAQRVRPRCSQLQDVWPPQNGRRGAA